MLESGMPNAPFKDGTTDYGPCAANCHARSTALVAAGFPEPMAFRFTVEVTASLMAAMHLKSGEEK